MFLLDSVKVGYRSLVRVRDRRGRGGRSRRSRARRDSHIAALQRRIAELEAALAVAQIDAHFGILTRRGIDQRWHTRPAQADTVLFFDIDGVHAHNTRWGYSETDRRITAVLAGVTTPWVFRWFSGDEFGALCAATDAGGLIARVQARLAEQEMTATFGVAPIPNNDLQASMDQAAALVQAAKAQGRRGTINRAPCGSVKEC